MRYNSTIAISFFGRTESPAKKALYLVALTVISSAALWIYGMHLYHLIHPRLRPAAGHAAPVAMVTTTVAVTTTLKQPVVEKNPVSPSAEKVTFPPATAPIVAPLAAPVVSKPVPIAVPTLFITGEKVRSSPVQTIAEKSPVHKQQPVTLSEADKLSQAAQQAFASVMDMAAQYPDIYGFKPGDLLQDARLGDAIPIYTILQQDCAGYQAGQPVKPLLKPAEHWVFPVFVGDQIRCLVQVSRDGHNFVPGSGSKILAVIWNNILEKWPPAKGYHPQLIFNPDMPDYFFTVPELETPNLTDTSAMIHGTSLSPADVILASWR
jgi:hypothetical protein